MSNPPIEFLQDKSKLSVWLEANPTVPIVAGTVNLVSPDFSKLALKSPSFAGTGLESPNFSGATLVDPVFDNASVTGGAWAGATLSDVRLPGAKLTEVDLSAAKTARLRQAGGAELVRCGLRGLDITEANFKSAKLTECALRDAILMRTHLIGVAFQGSDLRGADLRAAELTNTTWYGTKVDHKTNLAGTIWRPQHDAANDGAEDVAIGELRRLFNWETIRVLGRIPLFSGSYALLTVALFVGSTIVLLNDWLRASAELSGVAAVPFPERLSGLLLGSAALAVGATVFEFTCPARVKEFSRTQWVEELQRPGLLYIVDSLKRPGWNAIASIFTGVGSLVLAALFVDRLVAVVRLIWAAG